MVEPRKCLRHWWIGDSMKLEYCKRCYLMRTYPKIPLKKLYYSLDDIGIQGQFKKKLKEELNLK